MYLFCEYVITSAALRIGADIRYADNCFRFQFSVVIYDFFALFYDNLRF